MHYLLSVALLCVTLGSALGATDKIVCYWSTWSHYRLGNGQFRAEDIDTTLCTHIIYGFVGLKNDGSIALLDPYLDIDLKNFERLNALKNKNSNLKTLLAIGGWNEGSIIYSAVAADPAKRAIFIENAVKLVETHGFDGFDIDWEYPAQRGGAPYDIQNYITLLKEFREVFDQRGWLLSAAVVAAPAAIDLSYDVPAMSKYLDLINVMAYDLHAYWDHKTGQNAPLYPSSTVDKTERDKTLNVDAVMRGWLSRGAPKEKLILGVAAYGRSFTLADANNNQLGAASIAGAIAGKYTGEAGFYGYHEIVELQNAGGWTVVWDDEQKTPFAYKGNQWVGYDDPRSVAIKAQYAMDLSLGGVMLWSIDTDDFRGLNGTKYALTSTIKSVLGNSSWEPEITSTLKPTSSTPEEEIGTVTQPIPEPTTTEEEDIDTVTQSAPEPTTREQTTLAPAPEEEESEEICTKEGYFRDKKNCSLYYYCQHTSKGWHITNLRCSNGLVYDIEKKLCNYPSDVKC